MGVRELMPLPATLSVDVRWTEPDSSADPRNDTEAARARIALGLDSRTEVVARERGIGQTAAAAIVARNMAEDRALADTEAAPATPQKRRTKTAQVPADA